ncbi:MAG: CIA30 family protein [Verrucomicrobiota bacterium]
MSVSSLSASDDPNRVLFDFRDGGPGSEIRWKAVNDGVMGGLSRGGPKIQSNGRMLFSGRVSLENNGGFSSMRTEGARVDLSSSEGVVLRVKGDGRTYELRLSTGARFRSWEISYRVPFKTKKDQWVEVKIPFSSLIPSFRGRILKGPEFDPSDIRRLGVMIADKNSGPFSMEVDWIKAYGS